jgi:deoxyribonuclease V
MPAWPTSAEELVEIQHALAHERPEPFRPGPNLAVGGCFVCFPRGKRGAGNAGDLAWAAASLEGVAEVVVRSRAGAPYEPGLLALREGPALEQAVQALDAHPNVLLVDATGRDHPRGAGLALHLGAILELPTVGVTHRPLLAAGPWPPDEDHATAPLILEDETVGYWLRTRRGTRPMAVHAAWRTDAETAVEVVLRATFGRRTPEPLRQARRAARTARARAF